MKISLQNERDAFFINNGFTFSDEFNETLDSASVIISKLNHKPKISPYDFCRILQDNGDVFATMLVDNYQIKEITLEGTKTYQATIELMSLTKLLEKIQLPNRVINHSLVNGQQTIEKYILDYWELYAPKVKTKLLNNTWEYIRIFDVNKQLWNNPNKFNVKCRDMGFSQPTLRQAIANLMLQVGCIPVIKAQDNGRLYLDYLDFNQPQTAFNITDYSANYTNISNASDSQVNNLITMADNILDDENVVITESVGFRDKDTVLLKKVENLKLNTKMPIYSVESCIMNLVYTGITFNLQKVQPDISVNTTSTITGGTLTLVIYSDNVEGTLHVDSLMAYIGTGWSAVGQNAEMVEMESKDLQIHNGYNTFTFSCGNDKNSFAISGSFNNQLFFDYYNKLDYIYLAGYNFQIDISKLVVENSKRQLLETNFLQMENVSNIDELAQYIYGTVGYSIGGTEISGFSQTYNKAVAWWKNNYSYFENINNQFKDWDLIGTGKELTQLTGAKLTVLKSAISSWSDPAHFTDDMKYANIFFDIKYKPLNSMRLEISKQETIDLPISQLDTAESSIYALNDLAINEQEKVDRLGNEIITINQRTTDASEIQPLNSKYGEYVIFKRTVAYEQDFYKVNYVASKNYVLKNYFTSIQTKYRAYEYTSYESAVIRKENTKVYVLVDTKWINGTDSIDLDYKWLFVSGILEENQKNALGYSFYKINYVFEGCNNTTHEAYLNEISVVDFKNNLVFNYQQFDSVSYGIYISNTTYDSGLGGLPQQWYIKDNDFYEKHLSIICSYALGTNVAQYPKTNYFESETNPYDIKIVEYDHNYRTWHLDKQEKLNHTLQFEYYTTNKMIERTNKLQELCYFKNDNAYIKKAIALDEKDGLKEQPYETTETLHNISDFITLDKTNNKITITWGSAYYIKIVVVNADNTVSDIMGVERLGNNLTTDIYVSLNDTKSFNVLSYNQYGVITFNEFEAETNTNDRNIIVKEN